jgi:hypothetical protein
MARLGVPSRVAEALLNHAQDQGIEGVYDQHDYWDERRAAMQRWSDRVEDIFKGL